MEEAGIFWGRGVSGTLATFGPAKHRSKFSLWTIVLYSQKSMDRWSTHTAASTGCPATSHVLAHSTPYFQHIHTNKTS